MSSKILLHSPFQAIRLPLKGIANFIDHNCSEIGSITSFMLYYLMWKNDHQQYQELLKLN